MPLQKVCTKCKQGKPVVDFYANKRMKDGLNTFCIVCHKADNVARKAVKRDNPTFHAAELTYKKQYRERTRLQQSAYMQEWRKQNQEYLRIWSKQYRADNKAKYNYLCQLRKISLVRRTPKWLDAEEMWLIEEAYQLASLRTKMFNFSWHVDHVIPLRGKLVSGLHVPNNLRVIPWLENQTKTNKYEV
jgi:hypothetical protein